eukprot:SAG11_NODE_2555_length_3224_cov_2.896640_6_plen_53_part_00
MCGTSQRYRSSNCCEILADVKTFFEAQKPSTGKHYAKRARHLLQVIRPPSFS